MDSFKTIEFKNDQLILLDQTKLPHHFEILELKTLEDAARAIETMQVRGAPWRGSVS